MSQWSYNQYSHHGNRPAPNPKDEDDFSELLEDASKDELQMLIDNEDKILEIVMDDKKVKDMKMDNVMQQASNRSIADDNISKEPHLTQLRDALAEKYETLKQLNDTFLLNQAKLESLQKDTNLETTLAVLQTTCAQTEEESEELAEAFFAGNLSIGEFLTQFKAKRMLAHNRHIKTDKMKELVLEVQRQTSTPAVPPRNQPTNQTPAYPGSSRSASHHTPYSSGYGVPQQGKYPGTSFNQPTGQQYPGFNWK
uniref:Vacuolar protein sorting-associated protein 37B-like n=1 Tax=Ciona intestinalis TaxID=7719 RepID=F6Z2L4_CIOIN|nr:vacuolar protein sorting-associated protein 37B-like [Ciona intestinalis]|eukprot:XP_002126936.1 vacuolar protein sorting-associated protein 37B-like [Ciona intestinalis]